MMYGIGLITSEDTLIWPMRMAVVGARLSSSTRACRGKPGGCGDGEEKAGECSLVRSIMFGGFH